MAGKVTINIGERVWGPGRMFRNPWRTKGVANFLAYMCQSHQVSVSVENRALYFTVPAATQKFMVINSAGYAKDLKWAGVTDIVFPKGTNAREIKTILDALASKELEVATEFLVRLGYKVDPIGTKKPII